MKRGKRVLFTFVILALAVAAVAVYLSAPRDAERLASSPLRLNEVMFMNKGAVADEYGEYPDYIELYNTSDKEEDIGGMGLSDDITDGVKFVFPAGTKIAPHGYMIVWCSGVAKDASHAKFRVSSAESVMLYTSTGGTVETLMLKNVAEGMSYALDDATGAWEASYPSPGYPNDEEGILEYEKTMISDESTGVYINEFMPSNSTTVTDAYGDQSDWIELYNSNAEDIDISGWGISDTMAQPKKYIFPEGTTIPGKGYLVIFCSGNEGLSESGELHAPFSLKAFGEDVVLANATGAIIDSTSYTNAESDISFARTVDGTGEFAPSSHPTPGFPNSDEGYAAFAAANAFPRGNIMISELTGNNISLLAAKDKGYYDLIELTNTGAEPVSLSGYHLSDNPKNPAKWAFPDVSLSPGDYLIVYASGLDKYEDGELHANFSISAEGEGVYLFDPSNVLCDRLQSGVFLNDVSFGRDQEGALAYFESPSFGNTNGRGSVGVTAVPVFDVTPGVYDSAVDISISVPEGETVYYTLDCTTPTAESPVYTAPIHADKNTVVRAVSMRDGYITNATTSATYLFTADGVDHSLKIATLVTDPDNLWSSAKGIYAYGDQYDPELPYNKALETAQYYKGKTDEEAWERPASFSVYSEDKRLAFTQNVGIRIAGSFGRGRAQKGFNIIARDIYGSDRMEYPFFDSLPYTEYKAVVLRAGAQDANRGKFRDELAAGFLEGSGVDFLYQTYEPYVLYLNGEYWGVYFLKEKRNRFFVAQHENTGNVVDMDIIHSATNVTYGSSAEWKELMSYVSSHSLTDASAYAYVDERVDLSSFMDYMICEIYSANSDTWNIQYYKLDGGKWKWIYYDFCWSFGASENGYKHNTLPIRRMSSRPCSDLFNKLLEVSSWREAFIKRTAELLKTVYTPERGEALINELYSCCEPEIAREREKFCSETFMGVKQHSEVLGTYEGFTKNVEQMREFVKNRPDFIKSMYQKEFGLTDSYIEEVF